MAEGGWRASERLRLQSSPYSAVNRSPVELPLHFRYRSQHKAHFKLSAFVASHSRSRESDPPRCKRGEMSPVERRPAQSVSLLAASLTF
ncbi:hypothetical protein EYF80_010172 [Liparis tanakae]|uniref:Uncharacterized protein n=1 Tax=Liparis tanakae TaxID=230148 RepID=A0A4Z2INF7_9TELE|nr:hypothetical protein EYF80_010172 [Liparis tanakae]